MPCKINGEECLNLSEAEKYLEWNYATIVKHAKERELPWWELPGKGRSKYYRKSDLDTLKTPRQKMNNKK